MITTIAIILLILWLLGFMGFHVLGGFIHILLVIAIILFLVRIIRGENPFGN
jgi:asparagine N-glycosylation enzyme membrane subunit Stt3